MPRICSSLALVAALCVATSVSAQDFSLGFDLDACGQDFKGDPGTVMTFDFFLTLTAAVPDASSWTISLSITGPEISFDKDVIEKCDTDCKEVFLNSPTDYGLKLFNLIPTTTFVVDPTKNNQGTGIVDTTILDIFGPSFPVDTLTVLRVKFDVTVPETGSEEVRLEYRDGLQGPGTPVDNILSVGAMERTFGNMDTCVFTITSSISGGSEVFVRGDVDHSGRVSLNDAINTILKFFDGKPLPCDDAADSNDDGMIDQSDVVSTLTYLFVPESSSSLPAPFASPGEDPTPDDLGCETGLPTP